uniref:Uncharacterized protein n=1 Tax=Arundo donax TaxID=35708 RepID=A0A0A9AG40_ARUDO
MVCFCTLLPRHFDVHQCLYTYHIAKLHTFVLFMFLI